jgi:hypothetical protein
LETLTPPSAIHQDHEHWIREVRDPAIHASEGIRRIEVRNASAEYEIAPLHGGIWAMRTWMQFRTGSFSGSGTPWRPFQSREACLEEFLRLARRHFSRVIPEIDNEGQNYAPQIKAGKEMMKRLEGDGLFGFIEPDPV